MLKEDEIIIDRDSLPKELRDLSLEELLPNEDDFVTCELFTGQTEQILLAWGKLLKLKPICSINEEAQRNLSVAIELLFDSLVNPTKLLEAIDALDELLLSMDLQDELLCCMHEVYNLLCPLLCLVLANEQQIQENVAAGIVPGPPGGSS